jgi:hypothetical protein
MGKDLKSAGNGLLQDLSDVIRPYPRLKLAFILSFRTKREIFRAESQDLSRWSR